MQRTKKKREVTKLVALRETYLRKRKSKNNTEQTERGAEKQHNSRVGRAGSQEDKRVKGVYRGLRRLGEVRNVSEKDRRIRGVRSKDTGTKDTISRFG